MISGSSVSGATSAAHELDALCKAAIVNRYAQVPSNEADGDQRAYLQATIFQIYSHDYMAHKSFEIMLRSHDHISVKRLQMRGRVDRHNSLTQLVAFAFFRLTLKEGTFSILWSSCYTTWYVDIARPSSLPKSVCFVLVHLPYDVRLLFK